MQPVVLPGFLQSLSPLIEHHGYVAVGGLVLLEDLGLPVPGETVLIAAAVFAGAGRLNVVVVALVAFVCAVLGDNIGYLIGRVGGRALVVRYGRYILLNEERLARAEAFFERQGPRIITVARFIEGLRQLNGIVSGTSEMHWRRFLLYNSLGAAIWVALWVSVGDLAGPHVGAVYNAFARSTAAIALVLVALVLVFAARGIRRRRRAQRAVVSQTGDESDPPAA